MYIIKVKNIYDIYIFVHMIMKYCCTNKNKNLTILLLSFIFSSLRVITMAKLKPNLGKIWFPELNHMNNNLSKSSAGCQSEVSTNQQQLQQLRHFDQSCGKVAAKLRQSCGKVAAKLPHNLVKIWSSE